MCATTDGVWHNVRRCTAEIIMFDDVVVVYKFIGDLMFFVTGSCNENELILYTALQAFHETLSLLLRYGSGFGPTHDQLPSACDGLHVQQGVDCAPVVDAMHPSLRTLLLISGIVEKKTVLENLDLALLTIDEIVDGGYVVYGLPVANRRYSFTYLQAGIGDRPVGRGEPCDHARR